jgi:RHS repeat-associated protein
MVHNRGPLLEETDYYPFGLIQQGISSKAPGSLENRKKFNGIEHTTEFDLNTYDAFYRNADPQIGRWWQIDPKPNVVESPYSMMSNNPIRLSDPLGDKVIVNKYGDIVSRSGTDNLVFMQNGKALKPIGELGKKIDTKDISKNILARNKEIAKILKALRGGLGNTVNNWKNLVTTGGHWDCKNNTTTVFGAACAYDEANKEKVGGKKHNFLYQ